jgi:small-conductance mechanosensitive channel
MAFFEYLVNPDWSVVRHWVIIVLIGIITFLTASLVGRLMRKSLVPLVPGSDYPSTKTRFVFLRRIVIAIIYILGASFAIFSIPELRTISYSMFAGAGILAVILGFAAQKAFGNVMSGIFIAVSKPFRIGDRIMVDNNYGVVEDLTLRQTIIHTPTNDRIVIPNSKMDDAFIQNYSLGAEKVLSTFDVGISYESDIDQARQIIEDEIIHHPRFTLGDEDSEYLKKSEHVKVRVVNLGDFSIVLRAYFWADNKSVAFLTNSDLLESIRKRFNDEGVEIPYPHRTIVYKAEKVGKSGLSLHRQVRRIKQGKR